ncbi:MAG: cyclic nucleotide-binding domain-containing protein, partial [Planctomycetota bacterium]
GGVDARSQIEKHLTRPGTRFDAILSMIRYMGDEERKRGYQECRQLISSEKEEDHVLAARILGEIGTEGMPDVMKSLVEHASAEIRNEVIKAASVTPSDEGLDFVTKALFDPATKRRATRVIGRFQGAAQRLESLYDPGLDHFRRDALVRAAGFVRSEENVPFLTELLAGEEAAIRLDIARALSRIKKRHDSVAVDAEALRKAVEVEVREAFLLALAVAAGFGSTVPNANELLLRARENRIEAVFRLLGLIHGQEELARVHANVGEGGNLSNAIEFLDTTLDWPGKAPLIRLLEETPDQLGKMYGLCYEEEPPPPDLSLGGIKDRVINALVVHVLAAGGKDSDVEALARGLTSEFGVVRETTARVLLRAEGADALKERLGKRPEGGTVDMEHILDEGAPKLSAIEKVLFLKGTDFFRELGGEYLLHISKVATESEFTAGETIFSEGDLDRSMFIVVEGSVRIEVHGKEVNVLASGSCFGEMALLDGQARSASAVAVEATHALKIEYDEFFELITERPEIAKGVMAVLSERLRSMLENK